MIVDIFDDVPQEPKISECTLEDREQEIKETKNFDFETILGWRIGGAVQVYVQ